MTRAEGYYNLGLVHKRKGQPDLAIQAYREATRVNPRMADAHYNIANLFMDKGQYSQAISHYRLALEIRPNWEKAARGLEQAEATQEEQEEREQNQEPGAEAEVANPAVAAPPKAPALDPTRTVDPQLHGEVLRLLHRHTIDSENQGRDMLKTLLEDVEPAIKELSMCLLYSDSSLLELGRCLEKFDVALGNVHKIQDALHISMTKVRQAGDLLLKS